MMLDEAIKHCEEVMMENLEKTKDRNASDPISINCFECAEEHRQLAEWLKDYKRLLEQDPSYNSIKTELEPCGDTISRQAVLDALDKSKYSNEFCEEHHIDWSINLGMAHIVVNELKPVTPQPKMGRWEWLQYDGNPKIGNWHCSECGCIVVEAVDKNKKGGIPLYKYCPQCGCKMQEVEV